MRLVIALCALLTLTGCCGLRNGSGLLCDNGRPYTGHLTIYENGTKKVVPVNGG